MSKIVLIPRLTVAAEQTKALLDPYHKTLVSSFQSIQPAIDTAIAAAVAKLPTLQQVFNLSKQTAVAATPTVTPSPTPTPSSPSTFQLATSTPAFTLVRESAAGIASIVNNTTDQGDSILGLTQSSGPAGAKVPVYLNGSLAFNIMWSWTPYSPVFASTAGAVTQTPPTTGYLCLIGYAVSAQTILLVIGQPVFFGSTSPQLLTLNANGTMGSKHGALSSVTNLCAVNIAAGQPVYADPVSGQFKLANAAALASSPVVGLLEATTAATFVGTADQLSLTLANWTATVGASALTKGAIYYLGTSPGTLTTVAPTTPGQCVVRVGTAALADGQTLALAAQQPILL